jgi:hypothetical protein
MYKLDFLTTQVKREDQVEILGMQEKSEYSRLKNKVKS